MRRKKQDEEVENDRELLTHLRGLGLESIAAYRRWCAENGFSKRLNKHWKQRCRERYFAQESAAKLRLRVKKKESRNPIETIAAICEGQVTEDDVTQSHLVRFCQAVQTYVGRKQKSHPNIKALIRLVSHLQRCRTKLIDGTPVNAERGLQKGNTYLEALVLIATCSREWLRPVEDWKPLTRNTRRQFASLLRHLFSRYNDIPRFFDSVWFAEVNSASVTHQAWYLHVGRGENIRTCKLPIRYTKKMAHHFMRAPDDLTIVQALRWGQIHALGGNEPLSRAIFGTRLGESFEHEEFWSTVIKWFVDHPMLDRTHVGPIIDYLHFHRFVPEQHMVAPGTRKASSPPQPHLSMRGRTPGSLLRQVNKWHGQLANDNRQQIRQWLPSGIEEFEFIEGTQEGKNLKVWTIRELLGSKALIAEGRQLKHCVASYASSCARGYSSIWTMEVESYDGTSKALTIEVRNNMRTICQARGKLNRLPTDKERGIISRWAAQTGLKIASYV